MLSQLVVQSAFVRRSKATHPHSSICRILLESYWRRMAFVYDDDGSSNTVSLQTVTERGEDNHVGMIFVHRLNE
jgi:hypothetical protein